VKIILSAWFNLAILLFNASLAQGFGEDFEILQI
jgi:hypothetical protein